jgi:hypothetical protein
MRFILLPFVVVFILHRPSQLQVFSFLGTEVLLLSGVRLFASGQAWFFGDTDGCFSLFLDAQ